MSGVTDRFARTNRQKLRTLQMALEQALLDNDQVVARRTQKSIATWTVKLLCPHTEVEMKTFRVFGFDKRSFHCPACKSYFIGEKKE